MLTQYNKVTKGTYLSISLFLFFIIGCTSPERESEFTPIEGFYQAHLQASIAALLSLQQTDSDSLQTLYFLQARNHFKAIEPILAFSEKNNYKSLNQPNFLKVEEEDFTDIKHKTPFGFQTLEESLSSSKTENAHWNKTLKRTIDRLRLLEHNIDLAYAPHHVVWLLQDAVVRIATMGTTGFDSPVFGRSLEESAIVYQSLIEILEMYKAQFTDPELYNTIQEDFKAAAKRLDHDFDSFDRFTFIQKHTHRQLELLVQMQKDWKVTFPFERALANDITNLFSPLAFNPAHFSSRTPLLSYSNSKADLGKVLFNDQRLSLTQDMSCATCHDKSMGFTDGVEKFPGQNRNTPTVLYAGLQKRFFHDARAGSLEGQITSVVQSSAEFHTDLSTLEKRVKNSKEYQIGFDTVYKQAPNEMLIRNALANYIRNLSPFESNFDKNINGKETTLSESAKTGFNLFMGKAQCGTCHFAPVFNGTIPPDYQESELESIGVPHLEGGNTIDPDSGRYYVFESVEMSFFFKTPTVRNSANTGPYMHNGAYNSLEEVINFYNTGGGAGLGIPLQRQTLPSDSLQLSEKEQLAIMDFLNSLSE